MVGKRAEAQMRVVVNEACDDDDDGVGGRADALGVCPPSHWRRLGSSGEHSRPNYQDPQKGEGGGTSSRRMENVQNVPMLRSTLCFVKAAFGHCQKVKAVEKKYEGVKSMLRISK